MNKTSNKHLKNLTEHVDCMIDIISKKLDSKLTLTMFSLNSTLELLENNNLDLINGLGIFQSDSQEIDILSSRLNTYRNVKKFIEEEPENIKEQLKFMISITSTELKRYIESSKEICLYNSKSIEQNHLENINGRGIIQGLGMNVDRLASELNVYLTSLKHLE